MKEPKNKILFKSRELFQRFGYQKTTLTDIAKSVGKVKTAIYYYFSGKEEIFAQLVYVEAEEFLEKLILEVKKQPNAEGQLRSYVETRVELMEEISQRYSFLKKEFFELLPIVEENRADADKKEISFLTEILLSDEIQSNYTIENPEFTATLLMQSIKGLEIQMYVTNKVAAHLENKAAFVDFILHGILSNKK
ncbi:MAG: TetR/AcrR family transcriptional regulator [Crocinitomicaceae bacterium]